MGEGGVAGAREDYRFEHGDLLIVTNARSFERLKEGKQIAELIGNENFVETLGHERCRFASCGLDVGVAEDSQSAAGVAEGGGGVGFVGDEAGELVVVFEGQYVIVI